MRLRTRLTLYVYKLYDIHTQSKLDVCILCIRNKTKLWHVLWSWVYQFSILSHSLQFHNSLFHSSTPFNQFGERSIHFSRQLITTRTQFFVCISSGKLCTYIWDWLIRGLTNVIVHSIRGNHSREDMTYNIMYTEVIWYYISFWFRIVHVKFLAPGA